MGQVTRDEMETIICFNEADATASIFTYNKSWQRHLEGRLGLKATMDNGFGGKDYSLPKARIKPPKAPRNLSQEAREKLTARLRKARLQKPHIDDNSPSAVRELAGGMPSRGNSIRVPAKPRQ